TPSSTSAASRAGTGASRPRPDSSRASSPPSSSSSPTASPNASAPEGSSDGRHRPDRPAHLAPTAPEPRPGAEDLRAPALDGHPLADDPRPEDHGHRDDRRRDALPVPVRHPVLLRGRR